MRTFKGSDKFYVGQAVGIFALAIAAVILNNQQIPLRGTLVVLAASLGLFLLVRWFMDKNVRGLCFDEVSLEIRYPRGRVLLQKDEITRIESVGSSRVPAWFIYTNGNRYLVRTQHFPHWIRLQILDQMQKFRAQLP
ncbi:hypothetical protein [Gallaecimonas xiamenensis]|uniref:Uncharacterized protein n=1 Tax=Gallaecimonas xiamenensis 3-C-1 TaxID=745411 RepID=K2ID77_9GAMM|nr:hypothetical protein [Gallaecimonas xiamenensis]EKE67931.1 hypothetical protein B3C1_17857 [Gallaecimonas xiamenensis 3-C-1]